MLFALLQDHALRLPTPDQIADPRCRIDVFDTPGE